MANRTSQHLDFLADHLKIVHVACIFVDFRIADTFQVEISPKCSVINRIYRGNKVNYINLFF